MNENTQDVFHEVADFARAALTSGTATRRLAAGDIIHALATAYPGLCAGKAHGEANAKKAGPLKTVTTRRCFGINATARAIGCHPIHLTYIMHGKRKPNETLRRRLARMGITCTVDGKEFEEVR